MSATKIGDVDVKSGSLLFFDFGVLEDVNAVVVSGLARGRYPVLTEYLAEDEGEPPELRRSATIDFAGDDRPAARTIELGRVRSSRVGVFDVDTIGSDARFEATRMLLAQIHASPTESGTFEIDGHTVCGFLSTIGSGSYPVRLEVDGEDKPLRCSIFFATPELLDEML